jgi:hypothetical protein
MFHWYRGNFKVLRLPDCLTSFDYKIPGCPDTNVWEL